MERNRVESSNDMPSDVLEDKSYLNIVIVERDYKGFYERYALTLDEFQKEFAADLSEGMPAPGFQGSSYTLQSLVHMWYQTTMLGSDLWASFFSDMSFGLSESDIKFGNLAYIRDDLFQSLYGLHALLPFGRDLSGEVSSLKKERNNLWNELQGAIEFDPDRIDVISKWLEIRDCQICAAERGVRLDESLLESLYVSNAGFYTEQDKADIDKQEMDSPLSVEKRDLSAQIQSAIIKKQGMDSQASEKCKVTFVRTLGTGVQTFSIFADFIPEDYSPDKEGFLLSVDERCKAYDQAAETIGEENLSGFVIHTAEMVRENNPINIHER